ncbi:DoxX family protein [Nocardia brevicatena]|uniref:DoxX family protein n=1 Tax=Nocardia brevicatena TaxID=37327 RepID=UPI0002DAF54C|nr:DoxX family membrane protein [Nocardia brevicatena]
MDVVVLIGRVLFVILFLSSAFGHFAQTKNMAGYAQSKGVPMPEIAVLGSGALLLLGGLSILLGIWADLGALLLVIMLIPTAVVMHRFWDETDAEATRTEMVQFNKDIALAGAALMLFAFFAHTEDLGLTITGPLFSM